MLSDREINMNYNFYLINFQIHLITFSHFYTHKHTHTHTHTHTCVYIQIDMERVRDHFKNVKHNDIFKYIHVVYIIVL